MPDYRRDEYHTQWIRRLALDALSEALDGHLDGHHDGEMVYVARALRYSSFTGRDGQKRESWECTVESLHSWQSSLDGQAPRDDPADLTEEEMARLVMGTSDGPYDTVAHIAAGEAAGRREQERA